MRGEYFGSMRDNERYLPDSTEAMNVYGRMQAHAAFTIETLRDGRKRPARHNRRIERAALWNAISLDKDCAHILDPNNQWRSDWSQLVRPRTGSKQARYDAEAAIRTIPTLVPFIEGERRILHHSLDISNIEFENGIGDVSCGRGELCERWHEWLWTSSAESPQKQHPSSESEVLEMGCSRLVTSLTVVMTEYFTEHPLSIE
jgi:hypothetical protein